MQWGTSYGSTAVLTKNSPAEWLQTLKNHTQWYAARPGTSTQETRGLGQMMSSMESFIYDWDHKQGVGQVAGYIYNMLKTDALRPNTTGPSPRSATSVLTSMESYLYDWQHSQGVGYVVGWIYNAGKTTAQRPGSTSTAERTFSNVLSSIESFVYDYQHGQGVGQVTGYIYDRVGDLKDLLTRANDMTVADSSLLSKGLSDILAKMDNLNVSVSLPSVTVDMSGVESRLDDIKFLLGSAGVIENGKDFLGFVLGDLALPATFSAIDSIEGALSTAFPFCLPSVVNLVLFGSVVADPQPPCWEFDISGSPLVVDFAPFEDFAEVCRWTVRLLFVAALLLNTRKFVYGIGATQV